MASPALPPALARAQRSTRKKRAYRELTSHEELSDTSTCRSRAPAVRFSRRVQRRSYKEDDDSTDASQSTSNSDLPRRSLPSNVGEAHSTTPSRRANTSTTRRRRRISPDFSSANRDNVPRKKVKLSKANDKSVGDAKQRLQPQIFVSKIIPPWQELEYQILVQIFKYAAYPLYTGASHSRPSIHWLLDVSLLSKSFRAAAIAALLHCPPLFPADRAHGLLRLLRQDQDVLSTNYRTKIREMNVEAKNLLMKKSGVVLQNLVGQHTPLLSKLNIYHNFDLIGPTIWSRPFTSKKNWAYPLELFDALDDANIHLKGFSWNGRFPETKQVLERMPSLHERSCLHSLHSMSILNMTIPEKSSEGAIEDSLTTALSCLPDLKELAFENCELLKEAMLEKLPPSLQRLTLTNCANVNSHGLGTFLQVHGHELEVMQLRGNQAMDLGFVWSPTF